jgi:hypothetical protein
LTAAQSILTITLYIDRIVADRRMGVAAFVDLPTVPGAVLSAHFCGFGEASGAAGELADVRHAVHSGRIHAIDWGVLKLG